MKGITLILILSFFVSVANAQQESTMKDNFKIGLATMPQYAFVGTMRLDVDITMKNNNVLTIAPMFSFSRNSSLPFTGGYNSYDSYYYETSYPENIDLTGGGLKVTLRHFLGKFEQNSGLYVGTGIHYRYSKVEYTIEDWVERVVNTNPQIITADRAASLDFNQGGVDVIFGYQLYLLDNIYGDIFAGWGFRLSDFDQDESSDNYWSETIFDFGYSGYTPLLGLRIGVLF